MNLVRCVTFLLAMAALPTVVCAQDATVTAPAVTFNGFVSAAYSYNFARPASQLNAFRVFDFDDNSFKIDVAELVLQRAVSKPGEAGFRADFVAGSSIPVISASSGLFRDPVTGRAHDYDLQQAFVSYIAPLGRGLRLDGGKFITHAGAEVIEGYDGWNDNYSRSFLFGYAIPFTHTGVRATYAWSDHVSTMAMIANGWDNARDNNSGKTIGLQVALTPSPRFTSFINYIGGPERNQSSDVRHLIDLVETFKATDRLMFTFNYDIAKEKNGAGSSDARWNGLAGYVRYDVTPRVALAGRIETFNDRDGVRTGTAQRLNEITGSVTMKVGDHLIFRPEGRVDRSDSRVFGDQADPKKLQATASLNLAYSF